MWAMRSDDKRELEAYRALGSVDSVKMRLMRLDFIDWAEKQMLHPAFAGNGDGYAPLPMSDPSDPSDLSDPTGPYADECWDDRTTCGLLDENP